MIFNKIENFTLSLETFLDFLNFSYESENKRKSLFLKWVESLSDEYLNNLSIDDLNFILKVLKSFYLNKKNKVYEKIDCIKAQKEIKLDVDKESKNIKYNIVNEP